MQNEETLRQLKDLKLPTMAADLERYLATPLDDGLGFTERLGMMVDREWAAREQARLQRRLKRSKLRQTACVEDINYRHPRGLDKSVMQKLASCRWVKAHENVIITGPTGVGKSWLACALAHQACREGHTALYQRVPRLLQDLYVARADGSYARLMDRLGAPDVLVLDDFGMAPLTDLERRDLFEVIEDRQQRRSLIITSQLEVKHWHELIGDPTLADAILDRLVHTSHRLDLKGASMRPRKEKKNQDE